jgi:hypothetical protein
MRLAPLRGSSGPTAPSEPFLPDSYLTDGRRLFRVAAQIATGEGHTFASLEDCLTLEMQAYAPGELATMKLRLVSTPAGR